ncbi:MAG: hypothetical protein N2439_01700 [Anaerolineae bacterium]|nr:hypothetical protein [Anaerolineae bacterium]
MEIHVRHLVVGLLVIGLLSGLALLGRGVTPISEDTPQILTPERRQALILAQRARTEIVRLEADLHAVQRLMLNETPDAVDAMLLAQRIYAAQRNGTAATATARTALIDAAAAVTRYAAGGLSRQAAVEAVHAAVTRIQALRKDGPQSYGCRLVVGRL